MKLNRREALSVIFAAFGGRLAMTQETKNDALKPSTSADSIDWREIAKHQRLTICLDDFDGLTVQYKGEEIKFSPDELWESLQGGNR